MLYKGIFWYASSSQGVSEILNLIIISPQKVNKRGFGGRPKESILVWGYAKGFNIDFGGYSSTKRLFNHGYITKIKFPYV
jgi:hypothetical protein